MNAIPATGSTCGRTSNLYNFVKTPWGILALPRGQMYFEKKGPWIVIPPWKRMPGPIRPGVGQQIDLQA